jgi:hypothetical protein
LTGNLTARHLPPLVNSRDYNGRHGRYKSHH